MVRSVSLFLTGWIVGGVVFFACGSGSKQPGNFGEPCKEDGTCDGDFLCNASLLCGYDVCGNTPCSGRGTCQAIDDGFECTCDLPYLGHRCEGCNPHRGYLEEPKGSGQCVNFCEGVTCGGHGTCSLVDDQPVCSCDYGYLGESCDACDPSVGFVEHPKQPGRCIADPFARWISVPAGFFMMGSPPEENCREPWMLGEPYREITLTHPFEISATEVTQVQFMSTMGYNPSTFIYCGIDCPVETVTWFEAAAYCNELSKMKGLTACYTCQGGGKDITCAALTPYKGKGIYSCPGYRLPTEAEWECAYRAGSTTPFYNGNFETTNCDRCENADGNAEKIGWYCKNSQMSTHPVGQKDPNAWGLYDMAGNVIEWLGEWNVITPDPNPAEDPGGPENGTNRGVRGGSWFSLPTNLRAANRDHAFPDGRGLNLGFRPCRVLPP